MKRTEVKVSVPQSNGVNVGKAICGTMPTYDSQYIALCSTTVGVMSSGGRSPQKLQSICISLSIAHRLTPTTTVSEIRMTGRRLCFI